MRTSLALLILATTTRAWCQLDTNITLDLLRAPASPGSVLLGVAESEIQRPSDPTQFMMTLRQATNDFTALPKNFAVDLAPSHIWGRTRNAREILGISDADVKAEGRQRVGENIAQTFVLSVAVKDPGGDPDSAAITAALNDPQLGLGFKFAVCRGKPTAKSQGQLRAVYAAMSELSKAVNTNTEGILAADSTYQALLREARAASANGNAPLALSLGMIAADHGRRLIDEGTLRDLEERADLKAKADSTFLRAQEYKIEREGFFWDFAGGTVLDFCDRRFDNSFVTKAGLWTTLSWETPQDVAFQFMGRYLFNPEDLFLDEADSLQTGDLHNVDGGVRLSFDPGNGRFSFSGEALYRQVLNKDDIDPTWRLVANAEYDLEKNRRLTFSFGKNFDGTTTKSGNLVAALNLLVGFGAKKKL